MVNPNFKSSKSHYKSFIWCTRFSPVQKYLPVKKANTGIDADGTFRNFIKGDVIANIDIHRPTKPTQSTPYLFDQTLTP